LVDTTTGEAPVAMAVLRDETVEEWERVALLQARHKNEFPEIPKRNVFPFFWGEDKVTKKQTVT